MDLGRLVDLNTPILTGFEQKAAEIPWIAAMPLSNE
jgi:hypothetical protein